ncbi:MAG: T9SS type A sorting domain-containing protein [Bacteroidales bacterium]
MIRKTLLLSLILLINSFFLSAQTYVQEGTGDVSTTYPVYGSWAYGWYSAIYPVQEEIGNNDITKLAFYCNNGPKTANNQKIYIKLTNDETFSSAAYEDPENNGYILLFDGDITFEEGWNEIDVTAFSYDGTSNIILHWENRNGDFNYSYPQFNSTTSEINNNKGSGDDISFPTGSGFMNPYPSSLPNIRFYYESEGPSAATDPFPAENEIRVPIETNIEFNLDETVDNFDLYFGTEENPTVLILSEEPAVNGINTIDFAILNSGDLLNSKTDYYWKVVSRDGSNNTTSSGIFNFKTERLLTEFPYIQDFSQDTGHHDIVFYPGWYGDWEKTDWTYIESPVNWGSLEIDPNEKNIKEVYSYARINPVGLEEGASYPLITPRFDLSGSYDISFYWMNGNEAPVPTKVGDYDKTYFEASYDNGESWETLLILEPETAQTELQFESINLNNMGNAVKFRWRYDITGDPSSASNVYLYMFEINEAAENPIINLEETEYTFREVAVGGYTTHELQITNMSNAHDLIIESADAVGPYSCEVENLTILPTETEVINITFTPDQVSGDNIGSITFNTNGATGENTIELSGLSIDPVLTIYEYFETTENGNIPEHWNKIENIDDEFHFVKVETGIEGEYNTGPKVLRLYNNDDIASDLLAITPGVSSFAENELKFYAVTSSSEETRLLIGLMDDPYNADSFEQVHEIIVPEGQTQQFTFSFDAANTKPYIAFKHTTENTLSSIRIDDVEWESSEGTIPNCAEIVFPDNGSTDYNIYDTKMLNWSSGGGSPTTYNLYFGTDNPPTDIINGIDLGLVTEYEIQEDLAFNQTYYWQIIPENEYGEAVDCPVWSFTTMGDPTITDLPYIEGFDEIPDGSELDHPLGWRIENNNDDNIEWGIINNETTEDLAYTAPNAMHLLFSFLNPHDDWLFTPPIQLEAGESYELSFWFKTVGDDFVPDPTEKLSIYLCSDNTSGSANETPIYQNTEITNQNWEQGIVQFTANERGLYHLGFHGHSNENQGLLIIDEIELDIKVLSDENDIISFVLDEQTSEADINVTEKTVTIEVEYGTDVTALTPDIEVSEGATIDPESGTTQDFSDTFQYTVTAENADQATWSVIVTEALNNENDIISFVLDEQTSEADINATDKTVTIEVEHGSDVTALTPDIEVSEGATIDPESGTTQDFSDTFQYTVTAENADQATWSVIVSIATNIENINKEISIYPNPAKSVVNIDMPNSQKAELTVYNIIGIVVYKDKISSGNKQINVSSWEKGVYILNVKYSNEAVKYKIIVE